MFIVWSGMVGLLVWLIVEFQEDQKYYCGSATKQGSTNGFVKFSYRAAEPYSGPVDRVLYDID